MSVSGRLAHEFKAVDRVKGQGYLHAVQLVPAEQSVHAFVSGSQDYLVTVDWSASHHSVTAGCSCPWFAKGHACKHLWAVLVNMDKEGIEIPGEESLSVRPRTAAEMQSSSHEALASEAALRSPSSRDEKRRPTKSASTAWNRRLVALNRSVRHEVPDVQESLAHLIGGDSRLWYVLDLASNVDQRLMTVCFFEQSRKRNGVWSVPRRRNLSEWDCQRLPDALDRRIYPHLDGDGEGSYRDSSHYTIRPLSHDIVLPLMSESERFVWTLGEDWNTVCWDQGPEWNVVLHVEPKAQSASRSNGDGHDADSGQSVEPTRAANVGHVSTARAWHLRAELRRASDDATEVRATDSVIAVFDDGLVLFKDTLAKLSDSAVNWLRSFQKSGGIEFPREDLEQVMEKLCDLAQLPELHFSPEANITQTLGEPEGKVTIRKPEYGGFSELTATPAFVYETKEFEFGPGASAAWSAENRQIIHRDAEKEHLLVQQLLRHRQLRMRRAYQGGGDVLCIPASRFSELVRSLTADAWQVVADGKLIRKASSFQLGVTTDTDWFDLKGEVSFDGTTVALPRLLQAMKQKTGLRDTRRRNARDAAAGVAATLRTIRRTGSSRGRIVKVFSISGTVVGRLPRGTRRCLV